MGGPVVRRHDVQFASSPQIDLLRSPAHLRGLLYSEDEHDEVFDELEMIDIDLSDKKYNFYTHKPLAVWRDDEATTIDSVGKETVTWSRVDGLLGLDSTWAQYYHVGDVPLRGHRWSG